MVRVSNSLLVILNTLTLLISIPILAGGIWLSIQGSNDCLQFLDKPVIVLGVFVMLLSIAGLVGACFGVSCLLWVYQAVMFLLIVVLVGYTIVAFVVVNTGSGHSVPGRVYKEYRLEDYTSWLAKRVSKHWRKISSCLEAAGVCAVMLEYQSLPYWKFKMWKLSSIQSGCCKPSYDCDLEYLSPTNWTQTWLSDMDYPDCLRWSNNPKYLCYGCNSCKAALLDKIKRSWEKVAIINMVFIIFLIIVNVVGCCAIRNAKEQNLYSWKTYRVP